jgi:hypothetical protein
MKHYAVVLSDQNAIVIDFDKVFEDGHELLLLMSLFEGLPLRFVEGASQQEDVEKAHQVIAHIPHESKGVINLEVSSLENV